MDLHLEQILQLESQNENCVYLFPQSCNDEWKAYEQSAINLQEFLPEVKETFAEEIFPEAELKLRYIIINLELTIRYVLPQYCTSLGDEYIELTLPKP